ncbi:hypothetical protein [Paenibacillus sp. tmac-D7]|uniref:hypothetical protein n=1 Tax=Paenibacillus sp. tmac-D7 TaxID=2591462 RepID=UPI0011433984|nr:hypothetical protein [Paenibacillus sp. tmac-D7]
MNQQQLSGQSPLAVPPSYQPMQPGPAQPSIYPWPRQDYILYEDYFQDVRDHDYYFHDDYVHDYWDQPEPAWHHPWDHHEHRYSWWHDGLWHDNPYPPSLLPAYPGFID